jgi:tRNA modification GTPase
MPKTWSPTSNALPDAKLGLIVLATSTVTEAGLDEFGISVQRRLATEATPGQRSVTAATAERCRESVRLAESALTQAYDLAEKYAGDELVAAELRVALAELGKVIGVVYTDDLLERIFKTFCIGK